MLKCRQIAEQASQYIDGELSLWGRMQYRTHLMMCHHCRLFVHNFKAGIAMLDRLHREKTPQDKVERICGHVRSIPKD